MGCGSLIYKSSASLTQCMANHNLLWKICLSICKWKKKNTNLYSYGFDHHFATNIPPPQPNADYCGVYTCIFAELGAKYKRRQPQLACEDKDLVEHA